jgi:hypothetical protein
MSSFSREDEMNEETKGREDMRAELVALEAEMSESAGAACNFFACPGPDAPFVGMATCHYCYATQQVREILSGVSR